MQMEGIWEEENRYRSYLLRCWKAGGARSDEPGEWRFSLECIQTGKKRGFLRLSTLLEFLDGELKQYERGLVVTPPKGHK